VECAAAGVLLKTISNVGKVVIVDLTKGNSAALAMSTPEVRRQKSYQRNLAFLEGKKIGLIDHSVLK